jgi:hypothetical protein
MMLWSQPHNPQRLALCGRPDLAIVGSLTNRENAKYPGRWRT